jgi:hypothetical protein
MTEEETQTDAQKVIVPLTGVVTFTASGNLTAGAMSSASVFLDNTLERADWHDLPRQLARLDVTHLRMLVDLPDPVIPKLELLTQWRPKVTSDQTVRLAATAVLNEKLAARERSHGRTVAWIGVVAVLVAGLIGFVLGQAV